ncbi:uncharacterized protein A4U43_C01F27570 [Asparagus officinalis]|uniref:Polygalacturonase n=1 Tax=Asparagus officinalis TaxID=4686 RepID=A0A5P1FWI1_ASPOF|nr:polygalacturonase At1g48100-like [Asparagus officinalis]ONK81300.1 uncharacterized protein A4U43_C01F27570 [Asparagus officinalis]
MRSKCLLLFLIIAFLVTSTNFDLCNATRGPHQHPEPKPTPKPNSSPNPSPNKSIFNVLEYGAKGNGASDDTKAFLDAWADTCKAAVSTMVVPSGYRFLIGPISFMGPCQPKIVFQLDGKIIAPTSPKAWGSGLLQWIEFKKLEGGIRIQGNGTIEGQGSAWWPNLKLNTYQDNAGKMPQTRPTALRFYGSYNVTVTGITIQNSPQFHLKFDNCQAVQVFNMTVSSPGDSPNTDGIHLQNSVDVSIHHTTLSCGDDCVSIQTGCSNVHVHNVDCGPGHGISIGSLGKGKTQACVSDITVRNVRMNNTLAGVRIKTWQGGSGSVRNIKFSNIQVSEVKTPIDIDQFYCDGPNHCKNESSALALSQISYEKIKGTYTVQPVYLACSDNFPCYNISLTDIELKPLQENLHIYDPYCWDAYGELHAPTIPPVDCLQSDNRKINERLLAQDSCK